MLLKFLYKLDFFQILHNGLAYRLVAGKLAIIFQFLILTSRKSQNFRLQQQIRNERYAVLATVFIYQLLH